MKYFIFFISIIFFLFLNSCGPGNDLTQPRTILIVINGLESGVIEKLRLVHLQVWKKEGCFYNTIYTPLPAQPGNKNSYLWSCSVPEPALMTGTVFIGQNDIKRSMIQHMFGEKKTSFITNGGSYNDISTDFTTYYNLNNSGDDQLKDEMVFDKARDVIENENPSFLMLLVQGPGVAGNESAMPQNKKEKWYQNIWYDDSPYVEQMKKDDQLIEEFINWLQYKDCWTSTTLFVTGNHGEANTGGAPPYDIASSETELLILGKDVKPGALFDYAEITDIAPTIIRINNLSSLRYSTGRVLEEAFKWGPDSYNAAKNMKNLDEILINHHSNEGSLSSTNNGFITIDKICDWHKSISPITLNEFIKKEEQQ